MAPNKDRVYIALYARGGAAKMPNGEDTYHWGIIVGPKVENKNSRGMLYNAKERVTQTGMDWIFEERDISLLPSHMLLVRIMIGKVENGNRLVNIVRNSPIKPDVPNWNCVIWVKDVLEQFKVDGKAIGTAVLEWDRVRDAAMQYCQSKRDKRRFDGSGAYDLTKVPTYDLIEGQETVQ